MWQLRTLLLAAAALLAMLVLSDAQQLTGTFTVGVAASLTGAFSEWTEAVNGYKLWANTINAAGGIPLHDLSGVTYSYGVKLVVRDDLSTADGHTAAVKALLQVDNAHFILGASPIFAESESIAVNTAGVLNFHCCTGSASIFARKQTNVFGISADNALYTSELFTEFRSKNIFKIAVIYRDDLKELQSTCQGVIAQASAQLLSVTLEIKYTNSSVLGNLVGQLAASQAEALVFCGLSSESSTVAGLIAVQRKPLKAIVLGGAYSRDWNEQLGSLSVSVLSFAHWAPDLPRKDAFWGGSTAYAGKYKSIYNKDPSFVAAAASATGYTLQSVLPDVFRQCTLSSAALSDPAVLLFTSGAITCTDNNNRGQDRLVTTLAIANMDTFYGANQGYTPVILQTYEVTESLQKAYKPSLVLPLVTATRPLLLPQHNLYAPTCQPGTFKGTDEFLDCIPCNPGEFQEFPGRTNCELCPRNSIANSSAMPECLLCPANTVTVQRGSTQLTDCICQAGYYSETGLSGVACKPCPNNAVCQGDTALPAPLSGFYAERDAPFTMYSCNPSRQCTGNFTCADGYRGRMCYYCASGHYRLLGNCVRCPGQATSVAGYLLVLAAVWIVINVSFARTIEHLMVVVNFCQLLSIVVSFSLNWPAQLYQIMSFSSILSFEMDSLEPTCLAPNWRFEHNLIVQLLLPVAITALVALWCLFTYIIYRIKQRGASRSVRAAASLKMAQTAPWKQVLYALLDVPSDAREMKETVLERFAVPLNFLNIGYLVLLKYCLSSFSCTTINGVAYMSASPGDLCYTTKHWDLVLMGLTGLVIYNGGFILLYGNVIYWLRKGRALGDKFPLLLYGWMYEKYEAHYYWYESVILVQRTGLVLVSLFIKDPALQAVIGLIITVSVLLMDIRTSAYVDKQIHILQAGMDGVLSALLVAGLLFYNPLSSKGVVRIAEVVLLVAVLAAFSSAIISIFQGVLQRLAIMYLMSKHRPIAYKMGQRVKGYRHVWLRRCSAEDWDDWHRLCMVLIDYCHPTSEVSYLSLKKVGRFWRYLMTNFPETIDYLVSVDEEQRTHFNQFIEVLYDHFFDTSEEHQYQLYYFVNDKHKIMKTAFAKAKGTQAATELGAAMNRSVKIANATTVLSAVKHFKRGLASGAIATPAGGATSTVRDSGVNIRITADGGLSGRPSGAETELTTTEEGYRTQCSVADSAGEVIKPNKPVTEGKALQNGIMMAMAASRRAPPPAQISPTTRPAKPPTPTGLPTRVSGTPEPNSGRTASPAPTSAAPWDGAASPLAPRPLSRVPSSSYEEVLVIGSDAGASLFAAPAAAGARASSGGARGASSTSLPAAASSRLRSHSTMSPLGPSAGDVALPLGNPDVEELAFGSDTEHLGGDQYGGQQPLMVRGDSAEGLPDGGSPRLLAPPTLLRTATTPRATTASIMAGSM
ncbi:hypothetical protein TSOC_004720, partial [Tetrabaena socialis]